MSSVSEPSLKSTAAWGVGSIITGGAVCLAGSFMQQESERDGYEERTGVLTGGALIMGYGIKLLAWDVGAPLLKRGFKVIKNYQPGLGGMVAASSVALGFGAIGSTFVPQIVSQVGGGVASTVGLLALGYQMYKDSSSSFPISRPALGAAPIGPRGMITKDNPLHVDAYSRIGSPQMEITDPQDPNKKISVPVSETLEFTSIHAALIGYMINPRILKNNVTRCFEKTGEEMMQLLTSLGGDDALKAKYSQKDPDCQEHRRACLLTLLRSKFGIGEAFPEIFPTQHEFREALKESKGNFVHPAIDGLIGSDEVTGLLQICVKDIEREGLKRIKTRRPATTAPSSSHNLRFGEEKTPYTNPFPPTLRDRDRRDV